MPDYPSSYKEKISPELDGLMKNLLSLFDLLELSEIKSLSVDPELYKSFEAEGIPNWTSFYTSTISLDEIFSSLAGLFPNQVGKLVEDGDVKQNPNIQTYLKEVIEDVKVADPSRKDLVISCWKQLGIRQFLNIVVLQNVLLFPAIFGEHMISVLRKAEQGDREAILKLVQIDKSLLGAEWSQLELRKAQLSGDVEYFEQVAKAITTAPLIPDNKNMKLTLVLVMGWQLGLKKLTHEETFDYVTRDLKIYGCSDPDSLSRQIKRLELRKDGT